MSIDILLEAMRQTASYWPLLLFVPAGQMLHELTHFAVARRLGAAPIIRIRLRTPMSVIYDRDGLSSTDEAAIGLAPTLAGLTAACAWLIGYGWPSVAPVTVAAAVGWLFYTLPSRKDRIVLAEWLEPEEGWTEPLRSMLIGMGTMALAALLPGLPYPRAYTTSAATGIAFGAVLFIGWAFYEHGVPDPESLD